MLTSLAPSPMERVMGLPLEFFTIFTICDAGTGGKKIIERKNKTKMTLITTDCSSHCFDLRLLKRSHPAAQHSCAVLAGLEEEALIVVGVEHHRQGGPVNDEAVVFAGGRPAS